MRDPRASTSFAGSLVLIFIQSEHMNARASRRVRALLSGASGQLRSIHPEYINGAYYFLTRSNTKPGINAEVSAGALSAISPG